MYIKELIAGSVIRWHSMKPVFRSSHAVVYILHWQERLAKLATRYDTFGKIRYVAGVDFSCPDDRIIGGTVVVDYETRKPVERVHAVSKL